MSSGIQVTASYFHHIRATSGKSRKTIFLEPAWLAFISADPAEATNRVHDKDIKPIRSSTPFFVRTRRGTLGARRKKNLLTDGSHGVWRDKHKRAMAYLTKCIVESKGVFHLNYHHPVMVCVDGSKQGIVDYLFQIIDGEERVISYFSRATRADEKKWDTREIEILAAVATLEHFHSYIDGQRVTL